MIDTRYKHKDGRQMDGADIVEAKKKEERAAKRLLNAGQPAVGGYINRDGSPMSANKIDRVYRKYKKGSPQKAEQLAKLFSHT